jgi:ABC-type multidrug transport system fused ATPase/permease subunit
MTDPHFEEDSPSVNLLNIDVARLLFSYLLRYRRHLFRAVALVIFITAARLIVPWLSGIMVDRYLVKKGFAVSTTAAGRVEADNVPLRALLKKGATLDDSTRFLFRGDLGRFSSHEAARLKEERVLSKNEYLLIRPAAAPPQAIQAKLSAGMRSGVIRGFANGTYLFSDNAVSQFTAREMILLRADDWRRVILLSLIVIALFLIQFVASYRQIIELMKLSQFAMRDLRAELYQHILSLELSYFDRNPVGRLVNRVSNDIETLNEMFSTVAVALFQDLLIMVGIVIVMFLTNMKLALAVAASFPFLAVITIVFRAQSRNAYRLIRTRVAHLNAFLNENITGMRIIQIFRREASQFAKFATINHGVYDANIKQLTVFAVFRPLIDFFRWTVVAAVIFVGSQAIVHASVSYGIIVMFLAYIANLFEPLGDLAEKFDVMQSANAAGEKILTVLKADAVREIDGPSDPSSSGRRGSTRFRGEIAFEDVWAAYTPGEWVLRGVSFSVPPRSTLAIVGETGSGKTTIINLLGRLYPWQKGRITVDGADLRSIPYGELRGRMAVVMQEMFLFSRTIEENLTLGAPFDEARWNEAVRVTHIGPLLGRLKNGRREMVMERGVTLSGGERQLCAFARALYADPSILVLDEATSNIDSETERLIQDALENLVRNRTSIVVAHRLSTVRNADKIIVIDKGTIAEEGDHASLIGRKGLYYELYKLQFETV